MQRKTIKGKILFQINILLTGDIIYVPKIINRFLVKDGYEN